MHGSGAMGSNLGNFEFNSQTDCVPEEESFKKLIKIGIASHNSKYQVLNDFPVHNQTVPSTHLKTEEEKTF